MGNYASCCVLVHSSNPKTARLMDSQGNLREVSVPVKAADIMLEEPGYVICLVEELRRTGRVIAMRADDEVLAGKLYLLAPLGRVHSKISELDMGIIESAATTWDKKLSRKKRKGAKVLPAVAVELREDGEGDEVKFLGVKDTGFGGHRSGNYRQWTPVLEPISEEF